MTTITVPYAGACTRDGDGLVWSGGRVADWRLRSGALYSGLWLGVAQGPTRHYPECIDATVRQPARQNAIPAIAQPSRQPARHHLYGEDGPETDADQQQEQMRKEEQQRLQRVANGKAKPPDQPAAQKTAEEDFLAECHVEGLVEPRQEKGSKAWRESSVGADVDVGISKNLGGHRPKSQPSEAARHDHHGQALHKMDGPAALPAELPEDVVPSLAASPAHSNIDERRETEYEELGWHVHLLPPASGFAAGRLLWRPGKRRGGEADGNVHWRSGVQGVAGGLQDRHAGRRNSR